MAITRSGSNLANKAFIPKKYSPRLLAKFYAGSVCNVICNRNWDGDIKSSGDTVVIRQRPDIAMTPYVENQKVDWQDINDQSQELTIDYSFIAATKLGIVDMHQMDINLQPEVVDEIANQSRLKIETTVLSSVPTSAANTLAYNLFTSWNTSASALKYITRAQALLDKVNAPENDRWLLIHPSMAETFIQETALYALNAGTAKGALQAGFVAELAGFKIYKSPLVAGSGTAADPYQAIAGHIEAITLASQFTHFDVLTQMQDYVGVGIRCINCFGFKVTKPELLVGINGYLS
jgi:hypothetical protein